MVTMTDRTASSLELTVGLPLDVIADKLRKLETELRLLNMKAFSVDPDRTNAGPGAGMETRVEAIYQALDSIRSLVADIDADVQPGSAGDRASKCKPKSDQDD
jgi:hypothetical protein